MQLMLRFILSIALSVLISSCGPRESRSITGDYCLDRMFEGDYFNITDCRMIARMHGETDNGPMDGTIQQLGWTTRYIVAWRRAISTHDPNGWMILDTQQSVLEGPYSDEKFAARCKEIEELANIRIYDVESAWKILED